jgi:hypothetical protein
MNLFKQAQNCLFVEEETYNWATPRTKVKRSLVYLSILFVMAGMLLGTLGL